MPGPVDQWKIEEVRRYLEKVFPASRLDSYPRGILAQLFTVTEGAVDPRKQQRHHLLVTRQFFDRYTDASALKEALAAADVARSLVRAGERTIELY
jgi:hypothetical protein